MQKIFILVIDIDQQLFVEAESALHSYQVRFHEFSEEVVFGVDFVRSHAEAIEILKSPDKHYDVVLLPHPDRKSPSKEFLTDIHMLGKEILVIILATNSTLKEALGLTRAGAFEFMVRPFSGEDLRSSMKKAARHVLAHRRALALEEERKKIRFQFISVLSHELKAPIAAVEGYIELMRDKALGDNVSSYDNFLSRSVLRLSGMRRLILDMLDLTRLESGQMRATPEELIIEDVIKETVDVLGPDIARRGIKLNLEIENGVKMLADRQHLSIVCNNLLSNAVKYNREQGTINFKVRRIGELIFIECKDSGIGIAKKDLQRLFGEFVRINTEETRTIPGSGLGLSILKKVVNLYQGSVRVDSELGVSTTFFVGLKDFPKN